MVFYSALGPWYCGIRPLRQFSHNTRICRASDCGSQQSQGDIGPCISATLGSPLQIVRGTPDVLAASVQDMGVAQGWGSFLTPIYALSAPRIRLRQYAGRCLQWGIARIRTAAAFVCVDDEVRETMRQISASAMYNCFIRWSRKGVFEQG
uniref:Uncharacterized protein n=1 Tax=Candidatus Kentrum sp. FW TaxID=2126338 RepID=A0A450STX1_9GAMM|nr:MAG: hypothetical protein BECKFW1821B_GA0114236_103411 [Candidatus Kentron sp. FW]